LVQELEDHVPGSFYQKLVPYLDRWKPLAAYADLSDETMPQQQMFGRWLRQNGVRKVRPFFDLGEYGLADAVPTVRDWMKRDLIRMPEKSVAYQQVRAMTPDDLSPKDRVTPEERMYAAIALARVVVSLELFPVQEKRRGRGKVRKMGEGYR
jgi:hypothetical protein